MQAVDRGCGEGFRVQPTVPAPGEESLLLRICYLRAVDRSTSPETGRAGSRIAPSPDKQTAQAKLARRS